MQKEKSKLSVRSGTLWVGISIIAVAAVCVMAVVAFRGDNPASSKNIRTAFIQKYNSCLKGSYDLSNGARISINPTSADGSIDPVISRQVAVLSTLNSFSKPSVLRFAYAMVNQDRLFNTHPAPQFTAADQETIDFLHSNCPSVD